MCGLIGFYSQKFTENQEQLLRELFVQSKIRGMHATGLTILDESRLFTIKESKPAHTFLQQIDFSSLYHKKLLLIGHTRYSTSDIEYNQPIADDDISIVHNGVVTQMAPELWPKKYGMEFKTKNDSEIIFHIIKTGDNPFKLKDASQAVICLKRTGELFCYRNGERPLWLVNFFDNIKVRIIASTEDIIKRSIKSVKFNIKYDIEKLECGIIYDILLGKYTKKIGNCVDLQQ